MVKRPDQPRAADAPATFVDGLDGVTELEDVTLEEIDREDDRFQFRVDAKSGDLVRSMRTEGQQVPVVLWRRRPADKGKPPYLIIDGFRRTHAVARLGWPSVKAMVLDISEEEAFDRAYTENVVRKSLKPLERATAICIAIERRGEDETAKHLAISKKQLGRYKELLALPRKIRDALDQDEISMAHALLLGKARQNGVRLNEEGMLGLARGVSAKELAKRLRKHTRKAGGRPKKYATMKGDLIRFYPFAFDLRTGSKQERAKIRKVLEQALARLDSA